MVRRKSKGKLITGQDTGRKKVGKNQELTVDPAFSHADMLAVKRKKQGKNLNKRQPKKRLAVKERQPHTGKSKFKQIRAVLM